MELKYKRSDFELMAPVGSYESLMAAIQGNANAVYFGIGRLNMRSKSANNFTLTDLEKIVEICSQNHIKAYVTVNTVMYDEELNEMQQLLDCCKSLNVSAIIASDLAVLQYAKKINLETHISTQQNVSNIDALRFFAQYADVVVLARELNMQQVKNIAKVIESENITGPSGKAVQIEMFAHGALCMAVSGKCYLSLHEYNHSANKGACLQICRRAYTVTDKETGAQLEIDNEYIMSPKDLCTIGFIDKMADAGVRVFKIEGRARSAEYVKTVAQCYHQALEALAAGTYSPLAVEGWTKRLSEVYNRGFWNGYYLGQPLGEWSNVYGSKATKKKLYVGKVMNYFSKLGVAEFLVETNTLEMGDSIVITGPTTGVIELNAPEIRVDLLPTKSAKKGERFSMHVPQIVRRSDKLYKIINSD